MLKKSPWIEAHLLDNYSSLHEYSLMHWLGLEKICPNKHVFAQFDFNLNTPFHIHPHADIVFRTLDASQPIDPQSCFSITQIKRWRIPIGRFTSFNDFVTSLIRWHRCNYTKSKKLFHEYGCTISLIEGDWTQHVDVIYDLYCQVAKAHGEQLYDRGFFHEMAKDAHHRLLCAWFQDKIIAMFVLQHEGTTLHATCCGMDYQHSSKSFAYSWLCYELIRLAIEEQKYTHLDVGLTADDAKQAVGFSPIPIRMDIYAKNVFIRGFLRVVSSCIKATITPDAKLKFRLKFFDRKSICSK